MVFGPHLWLAHHVLGMVIVQRDHWESWRNGKRTVQHSDPYALVCTCGGKPKKVGKLPDSGAEALEAAFIAGGVRAVTHMSRVQLHLSVATDRRGVGEHLAKWEDQVPSIPTSERPRG